MQFRVSTIWCSSQPPAPSPVDDYDDDVDDDDDDFEPERNRKSRRKKRKRNAAAATHSVNDNSQDASNEDATSTDDYGDEFTDLLQQVPTIFYQVSLTPKPSILSLNM